MEKEGKEADGNMGRKQEVGEVISYSDAQYGCEQNVGIRLWTAAGKWSRMRPMSSARQHLSVQASRLREVSSRYQEEEDVTPTAQARHARHSVNSERHRGRRESKLARSAVCLIAVFTVRESIDS